VVAFEAELELESPTFLFQSDLASFIPCQPFAIFKPFAKASSLDFLSRRLLRIDIVVVGEVEGLTVAE